MKQLIRNLLPSGALALGTAAPVGAQTMLTLDEAMPRARTGDAALETVALNHAVGRL